MAPHLRVVVLNLTRKLRQRLRIPLFQRLDPVQKSTRHALHFLPDRTLDASPDFSNA